jgi:hypothetical protein
MKGMDLKSKIEKLKVDALSTEFKPWKRISSGIFTTVSALVFFSIILQAMQALLPDNQDMFYSMLNIIAFFFTLVLALSVFLSTSKTIPNYARFSLMIFIITTICMNCVLNVLFINAITN